MAAPITRNFSNKFHAGTLLGQFVRLPLRLIPRGIQVPIRSGIAKGMIWVTGAHVHGCWLGTYENDKQDFCAKVVMHGMTVFDLGANSGFYTLVMARLVGGKGRVVAFEPDSGNVSLLRRHVVLNKLTNVNIVQAAVSESTSLSGFSLAGGATGHLENSHCYLVPTLCLDDALRGESIPFPDVIKMDVEGAEVKVLRGAKELINKNSCIWIVALHGEEAKRGCFEILGNAQYRLSDLQGNIIDPPNFSGDEFVAFPPR